MAVLSKIVLAFSSTETDIFITISILAIFRGSACIIFVTSTVEPTKSRFMSFDLIAIIETIQLPRALASKSVGEKASPFP
ncbi:hypothetical protein D9M69_660950 [compost metagenome]